MDLEKLMKKKVSRKDFMKSIGFILLALVFFPRKALSFITDNSYIEQKRKEETNTDTTKEDPFSKGIVINGVKVMEVVENKK